MTNIPIAAMTVRYDIKTRAVVTDATLEAAATSVLVKALWDTGATCTCIATNVAQQLGLSVCGERKIQTPSGADKRNLYLLPCVLLPNGLQIRDLAVTDTDIGSQGLGLLIGMDLISLGDFAITTYNDKTTFSFGVPSVGEIDFSKQAK